MVQEPKLDRRVRWQLEQDAKGCCRRCGKPKGDLALCDACTAKQRDQKAERLGTKRKYNCMSRRREAALRKGNVPIKFSVDGGNGKS